MEKWMFRLLVIFLVPRCHCAKFTRNKTGILFDEFDQLLVQISSEHIALYADKRACFRGLDFIEENYRSEHYGVKLLQNILKQYNFLTQLYNSGCKSQINGEHKKNESLSGKDITCGPFGCHKVNIRFQQKQQLQRSFRPYDTKTDRTKDQINIWLATEPPRKTTSYPTAHSLTTRQPVTTRFAEIQVSEADRPCSESLSKKDHKWLPLPFHPWGYCSKIEPVGAPSDEKPTT